MFVLTAASAVLVSVHALFPVNIFDRTIATVCKRGGRGWARDFEDSGKKQRKTGPARGVESPIRITSIIIQLYSLVTKAPARCAKQRLHSDSDSSQSTYRFDTILGD